MFFKECTLLKMNNEIRRVVMLYNKVGDDEIRRVVLYNKVGDDDDKHFVCALKMNPHFF